MRFRAFTLADAAFATLLLLVLALFASRGLPTVDKGSGFVLRSKGQARPDLKGEGSSLAAQLRLNPNLADARTLTTVPGVGTALAKAIVRFREVHGPFQHLSDLEGVPGIGSKRLQKMVPYLTLEEEEAAWSTK
ncbi:MAG: helix-hairpin-helix domain-containing protein [candidate division NC10 bacterium]|nr:helix-hairpin-helix domain-containing protein [candidate division NC10 bacterium]